MTCNVQHQSVPILFQPELVQSLLPRQIFDSSDGLLDCMTTTMTACIDGHPFDCLHTFWVSDGTMSSWA